MTLDTNIIIALLNKDAKVAGALSAWKKRGGVLFLPAVVEAELLSFSGWTNAERRVVEKLLESGFAFVEVIPNPINRCKKVEGNLFRDEVKKSEVYTIQRRLFETSFGKDSRDLVFSTYLDLVSIDQSLASLPN